MESEGIAGALAYSMKGVFYSYSEGNCETLEICGRHSSLFPVATIDPRKAYDFDREVADIAEQGFRIVRLFPEMQGWNVEQRVFSLLLKALDDYGLPLIISESPGKLYSITENIGIPIIFLSCHYYTLHETLAVFRERRNFYAEARHLLAPDSVEYFIEKIGADRLVFGSNSPFDYAGSAVRRIMHADISESAKNAIFSGNLERILQKFPEQGEKP
jgi:Predicted metal-dependent hydrolase of the TIM-barrel fold